jgi:acyl carrier protein
MSDSTRSTIREIVAEHGRLAAGIDGLADGEDLYQAGMTSHATVNVMLALEDEFEIEFPEEMLEASTFQSIEAIERSVKHLLSLEEASA